MITDDDLLKLYSEFRSEILSRHFALCKYFRANHLALTNTLGYTHDKGNTTQDDRNENCLTCDSIPISPTKYLGADDLKTKLKVIPNDDISVEQWRVFHFDYDNPLMFTGELLTCLAVEHYLELEPQKAKTIISDALNTISSLYKFNGNHFDGFILRFDPVLSDNWVTHDDKGKQVLDSCCNFLIAPKNTYYYCTPFDDPRYISQDDNPLRLHEPSMDELVGLVAAYYIVFSLVNDPDIKNEVKRQITNLADYLAEYGYLLVRPCGGFTMRGASGISVATEYPFGRVFELITGEPFRARIGFEGALGKAKVWNCLKDALFWYTIAGVGVDAILTSLGVVFSAIGAVAIALGIAGLPVAIILARTLAIYTNRDCFDVNSGGKGEFALAYLLKKFSIKPRFQLALKWLSGKFLFFNTKSSWACGFPPFFGLTAIFDSDTTVRDSYIDWFVNRRKNVPDDSNLDKGFRKFAGTDFAQAVATVLDAGEDQDKNLADLLKKRCSEFVTDWGSDHPDLFYRDVAPTVTEEVRAALDYMSALALAWLHAKQRADAGSPIPVSIGFPNPPPNTTTWSPIAVPDPVLVQIANGGIVLPTEAIPQGEGGDSYDLLEQGAPTKPADPPPTPTVTDFYTGEFEHSGSWTGDSGTDTINAGKILNGTGCQIIGVGLELVDKSNTPLGDCGSSTSLDKPDAVVGSWPSKAGAGIDVANINGNDETVTVHWWYNTGRACRYRIHYIVQGNGCSL